MATNRILQLAAMYPIVLGSGSPRRVRLLREIGVEFDQIIPEIDESIRDGEAPYDYAIRLAEEKSLEAGKYAPSESIVVGCDTIVVLDGQILGKPTNTADAVHILSRLAGKRHVVCTALALSINGKIQQSEFELTEVTFNNVSLKEIQNYVASGEPLDKAGAYGIQGMGAFLVDSISGNLDNVIGFPRSLLDKLAADILATIRKQKQGE